MIGVIGRVFPVNRRITLKTWVEMVIVLCFMAFFFAPLLNMALWAISERWLYPSIIPQQISFKWWSWVFNQTDLVRPMRLSFEFALIVTIISTVICIPAAYAFARVEFPLKKILYLLYLLPNAFPVIGLYVTVAVLFYRIGIMGTFVGVVFVQMIQTLMFMVWIPTASFKSVPKVLEDAARDIGASKLQTFWRVTLPLALPGIIVGIIFSFLSALDEAQGTLIVGIPKYITMPVQMYSLVTDYPGPVGGVFSVLLTTPSLVLLLYLRRFVKNNLLSKMY